MFDPTKPVATRAGRPARIIARDAKSVDGRPLIALVTVGEDERMKKFYPDGKWFKAGGPDDLVNIPSRTVEFVNYYPKGFFPDPDDRFGPQVSEAYGVFLDAVGGRAGTDAPEVVTLEITREDGKLISVGVANG